MIRSLRRGDLDRCAADHAHGRMRLKLRAVAEALDAGVPRVTIAASSAPRPVSSALAGEGTVIR